MLNAALIVAAGRGTRAACTRRHMGASAGSLGGREHPEQSAPVQAALLPKQYAQIGGLMVLARTMQAFVRAPDIGIVQVVIHGDDQDLYEEAIRDLAIAMPDYARVSKKLLPPVMGASSRQGSVANGLEALASQREAPQTVLVHDAARPFITGTVITAVIAALAERAGAIAALPVTDTLKRASDDQTIAGTLDREGLWRAQTPQGFRSADLRNAHRQAVVAGKTSFTDDAAIAEWAGLEVALVEGSAANIKLTTAEDIALADHAFTLEADSVTAQPAEASWPDLRTGTGFDVHRFARGDHLWLCGVKIAFDKTLEGHSDADVGLHALTDAILGAIAAGDIGTHFPPSDAKWKDAASDQFASHAAGLVTALGGRITNVDVTLLCEAPKIGPHRAQMCERIAGILGIDPARVSVKATTTERLGFTGRGEGIAAMASASVVLPPPRGGVAPTPPPKD